MFKNNNNVQLINDAFVHSLLEIKVLQKQAPLTYKWKRVHRYFIICALVLAHLITPMQMTCCKCSKCFFINKANVFMAAAKYKMRV